MKTCTKCKLEKPFTDFHKHKSQKTGLRSQCKLCTIASNKNYAIENKEKVLIASKKWRENNIDKANAYSRAWNKANPERVKANRDRFMAKNPSKTSEYCKSFYYANKDKCLDKNREWRERNKDKESARKKNWTELNREKKYASNAKWHKANPDKMAVHSRNRRSRSKNAEGSHSIDEVIDIFSLQRGLCASCVTKLFKSGKKKYHVDHIMPLAKGGANDKSNLQCLCPACNLKKHAKDPIDWAKENGRLI